MDGVIDWRTLPDRDGFTLTARKYHDTDSTPDDYECYTPKQVTAWQQDQWQFVGLVVTASVDGIELGTADLWSIEDGLFTATDEHDNVTRVLDLDCLHDDDYLTDLVTEAITVARVNIELICAKVAPAPAVKK